MKKILITLFFMAGMSVQGVYAGEITPEKSEDVVSEEISAPQSEYVFPTIEPEISMSTGYRYVHTDGDRKVTEFLYPHSSAFIVGEFRYVSQKHRLHLDLEYNNRKDYEGDISYAYKDLVLFRWINSTLFHNLDNTPPVDLNPSTATTAAVNVFDKGELYGRQVGLNTVKLSFKLPDFPAHLYVEGFLVNKDSTQQQKFLGGTASIRSGTTRVSNKKNIDLDTKIYTVGANSHLGPIEVDYSHSEKRLDVSQSNTNYTYVMPSAGTPPLPCDPALGCTYSLNVIPELKSSTDTLRLHTTYTGQISASVTLSKTEKENRENSARGDFFYGAADLTYMPSERITIFLKYRHKEADLESPGIALIRNLTDGNFYSSNVDRPISSASDLYTGAIRFRPLPTITLKGEVDFENIRREHNEEWNTPDTTEKTTMKLTADMRLYKSLKLKLRYTTKSVDDPGHNTEPDSSNELYSSVSWNPLKNLTTFLSYVTRHESRDTVHFLVNEIDRLFGGRKVDDQRLTGVVNYALLNNLSLTGTYAYGRTVTRQDITYACNTGGCIGTDPAGTAYADPMVPFRTVVQSMGMDLMYQPIGRLTLNGGITHTSVSGRFDPSGLLGQDVIDDLSKLKARETVYSASGEYRLKNGFGVGLNYRYISFKDVYENELDDVKDGRAHIVFLTLTKKW